MTSTVAGARPPRVAAWLIDLFASPDEGESILGDLQEEFSIIAGRDGESVARHWYWRQCVRTLGHLAFGPFRAAPWRVLGTGIAGLALTFILAWAVRAASIAAVLRFPAYYYIRAPLFWYGSAPLFWYAPLAGFMTGWMMARIASHRPMAAALSVVFAMGALMFVVDPIAVLIVGPLPRHTPAFLLIRGVWGLLMFSPPVMLGAVVGRVMAPRRLRRLA